MRPGVHRSVLCSAIVACAVFSPLRAQSTGPHHPVIVVIGSSTAAGYGAHPIDSAWVWRYSAYVRDRDSNAGVVNLAVPGYTTYHLMPTGSVPPAGRPAPDSAHNISRAMAYGPDILIINLPSNDAASGFAVAEQLKNYRTILAQIMDGKTAVFVATPQPRNLDDPVRRQWQMEMRDSTLAWFASRAMDFWSGLGNPDGTLKKQYDSGDGIHLNNEGHRLLFERALAAGIWHSPAGGRVTR